MNKSVRELDEKLWEHFQCNNRQAFDGGRSKEDHLIGIIGSLISRETKLLEIGFGTGDILKKLQDRCECYGADISLKNLELAKGFLPRVNLAPIGADHRFGYPDNFFDLFVAADVLEHMNDASLEVTVNEMLRVLKKGGSAIITFPAEEKLRDNECFCPSCGHIYHRFGHKQSWSRMRIREVFSQFDRVGISEYFHPLPSESSLEKIFSRIVHVLQTAINYVSKVPGRYFRNRIYIVRLVK